MPTLLKGAEFMSKPQKSKSADGWDELPEWDVKEIEEAWERMEAEAKAWQEEMDEFFSHK